VDNLIAVARQRVYPRALSTDVQRLIYRLGGFMRVLMNVRIPNNDFNAAVKDGSAGTKLKRILDEIKPEAIYFTEHDGSRGAVVIVDLPDPSKIPALSEPWFLTFNATVQFRIVMTPPDLEKAGLDQIGKRWT
jgi:hypothetical protein